ncbi:MAG: AsmA family protein [Burkholderiales bacterium]|nr:AsmA family protein [Burkholderiales bacterium]
MKALLESAAFAVDVSDAALALPEDSVIGAGARIAFAGRVATRAGAAVSVEVKGDAQGTPLALSGHFAPLANLLAGSDSQPVDLALALGDTRFEAAGTVSARGGREHFEGRARLAGPSVATLERVINANLPDLPAYAASASVRTDAARVELDDFTLRLGESTLAGRLVWRRVDERGRLEGRLSGKRVRLEDLAVGRALAAPAGSAHEATLSLDVKALERDATRLARFVRAFDADLAVALEDVTSAGAAVGRASAALRMDGGRLTLAPFALELAASGGTVRAELAIDARGAAPHYRVEVDAERLEYGPFARAADPKSANAGTLDLSMRLTSRGTPTELMRRASGAVDALVVPRGRVSASLFDLWSAGLLQNIWTRLDPGAESRLNCAVGSFDLAEGVLKSRLVLLDTTRVRVVGELEADFGTRKLGGRLAPRAKQPELFNPAPSVRVGGTFERPTVLPSPEALVIGALRLYGFAYAYALDWLTTKNLPADGTPDCEAAYRRVRR